MGMESVYKLSVILNMVDQLTAPMGRASQNLGSRLSGLQSGFGMAALAGGGMTAAGVGITNGMMKIAVPPSRPRMPWQSLSRWESQT